MKYEILKLLARNARYSSEEIATMLDSTAAEVEKNIEELEVYLKEAGFYEEYEKTLLELYTTNKKKD